MRFDHLSKLASAAKSLRVLRASRVSNRTHEISAALILDVIQDLV